LGCSCFNNGEKAFVKGKDKQVTDTREKVKVKSEKRGSVKL
jgi:hypothetical protein